MAFQDFTTLTEDDTPGRIALTDANTITVTDLDHDEISYAYFDKGVDHFGAIFIHDIKATTTAQSVNNNVVFWAVTDVVDTAGNWGVNDDAAIFARFRSTNNNIQIRGEKLGTADTYAHGATLVDVDFWCTAERTGETTFTFSIYDDAGRGPGSLLEVLAISITTAERYQYVFPINGQGTGSGGQASSFLIEDLDLNESTDVDINVSDSLTISEDVTVEVEGLVDINVSDALTITESVVLAIESNINVSDALTITESVVLAIESNINVSDVLTITESVALALESNIDVSDAITITEISTAEITTGLNINVSDSLIITEEASTSLPITFDSSEENYNASADSQTFSHTVASGACLVVAAGNRDQGAPTAVTYNGLSFDESYVNGQQGYYVWRTPAAGAHDVVITYSGVGAVSAHSLSYTGCHQTAIIGATDLDTGSGTDHNSSLTTVNDNSLVICFVVQGTNNATFTPDSSQNEREEGSPSANHSVVSGDIIKVSAGAQSMDWTSSLSGNSNLLLIEIKEAGVVPLSIDISEAITITESVVVENTDLGGIDVNDAISITESVVVENPELGGINISDSISITENLSLEEAEAILQISISDDINVTEVTSVQTDLANINVNDSITITEEITTLSFAPDIKSGWVKMDSHTQTHPISLEESSNYKLKSFEQDYPKTLDDDRVL